MNGAGLKKTYYYLKRNGAVKTWYAVRERLAERKQPPYRWTPPTAEVLERQKAYAKEHGFSVRFSVLVPAYRPPERCLRELLDSLLTQSYENWELILADAGGDGTIGETLKDYADARIRYVRLEQNGGISENTNRALAHAAGEYVGLLDHDDLLTPDALFEMAARIEEGSDGGRPELLYSDEDKCNSDLSDFFEVNRKEEFNPDLLLSNNYICHFLVMRRELLQRLGLRKAFDGAQDYDLVLRAAAELKDREGAILHIPKVLYHWRCHGGSTAENPQSKRYAYEAGRRAVQAFTDSAGWNAVAEDTEHLGFYRLRYAEALPEARADLGAVGGRLSAHGRICGGRMTADGTVLYAGLPVRFSGYLHRAVLQQDAEALDIRNIRLRASLRELFREVTGIPYAECPETGKFDASLIPPEADPVALSLRLSRAVREKGYRLLYLPEY